ncbi:FAD-dependent oxidoreductase [Actinoplanes sp. NEAU-A12]|uniref:FAD-dependent oxidoreductase n=1 Tax=Actinoplanes sandaracinus TaxID=3045177 RepID=A0ABT6WF25_9ACTN|nr:FAD-dependent oxidoreductase [Actinoplanes sandaracinus]MDI6098340.1 FAD-dependent oxidoreductase [Actinoplanes sandaracinus]
MTANVVVVGGGYGGITVARALDDIAHVTLVEPRETFVHNVAALRAAVSPEWTERMFIPYDDLLRHGKVWQERAVRVSADEVELTSGTVLPADFVVLATGSTAPFPAQLEDTGRAAGAARMRAVRDTLTRASHVLLLGAGPIGLELAGEIKAEWPGTAVTLVDPAADLLGGRFSGEFRQELREQLGAMGVRLLLGASLRALPQPGPGELRPFTVTTDDGQVLAADLWFPCFGTGVDTTYLGSGLAAEREPDGRLAVTGNLRLTGHERVFAVGDVTAVPELKMARNAMQQAEVAAANIRSVIEGGPGLSRYRPADDAIVLPLGPAGGATYDPEAGVLGAEVTAQIKRTFHLERILETLGAPAR